MTASITTHSQSNFDPQVYIDALYTSYTGYKPDDALVKFVLDSLYGVYKDGTIFGDRLLDIGTGPVCHGVYYASQWFKEIVLSDFAEENLEILRKWRAGHIQHQESVFKYMMKLEGKTEDWVTCNRKLSKKVCSIVHSDLHNPKPLGDTEEGQMTFDAITLTLCQNAASPTTEQYKKCVNNYSHLLKPGGYIVVIDLLHEDYYTIGQHKFKVLNATKDMIQEIYADAGYKILQWKQGNRADFVDIVPFLMVARKQL